MHDFILSDEDGKVRMKYIVLKLLIMIIFEGLILICTF